MTITACIIGAGRQGTRLLDASKRMLGLAVIEVGDSDYQKAKALAAQCHGRAVKIVGNSIRDVEAQAVLVCTPNATHFPIAHAALGERKHTFVEKPLATCLSQATELVQEAQEMGVALRVGFNHWHRPEVGRVMQWLNDERVGDVLSIQVDIGHGKFMPTAVHSGEWYCDTGVSGGGVGLDLGIHGFDFFHRILCAVGCRSPKFDVTSASCCTGRVIRPPGVSKAPEEELEAVLEADNGVRCVLRASWLEPRPFLGLRVEVCCTKGRATIDLTEKSVVTYLAATSSEIRTSIAFDEHAPFVAELQAFCNDILNVSEIDFAAELAAQRMLHSVYSRLAR